MQLQFHKTVCPCLQQVKREVQNQEQTQEVRLGEGMPDIGRVLGAWGQVLLRSKEWRSGGMSVSGGVMAWIMYMPEEGGEVRWVDTWIPFQMKWELPDTQHDGIIRAQSFLRSIDARSTSARKLMVRASIGVLGEALLPGEFAMYTPDALPEDIQVLKNTYPFCLPQEAGEKAFNLEEIMTLPGAAPGMDKLIRYALEPEILDRKVMGSKVVFRGAANLHILYLGEDGMVHSWDLELPFSQYGELEGDYDPDAAADITLAVTSLEVERDEEGNLIVKAGLTGQYVISNRSMVTVIEDAYSPKRLVSTQIEEQQIPVILEQLGHEIHPEQTVDREVSHVADVSFCPDHPRVSHSEAGMEAELPGQFSMLYYDEEGALQGMTARWEGSTGLTTGQGVQMEASVCAAGKAQAEPGSKTTLRANLLMQTTVCARQGIPMVAALELGESVEPDPDRPSLILRRVGEEKLWDIAKQTGSTVSAISEANQLSGEPEKQQILLIPIS